MKSPFILSLSALVLSAVALVVLLVREPGAAIRDPAQIERGAAAPDAELAARVAALLTENRELRERVEALELRPAPVQRALDTASLASKEDLVALREELRQPSASAARSTAPAAGDSPSPEFTARVQQAMAEIRVQEAKEGARKNLDSRSSRLKEKLPDVAGKLGLTRQQESALESTLLDMYAKEANYAVLWAEGKERSEIGQQKASDYEAFFAELNGILSPEQVQSYLGLPSGDLLIGTKGGR